jgi:hypothetical protein
MVKYAVLTFLAFVMSATTCLAMDRYYCTADDRYLKLSAETGFKELPGWPLSHLRAIFIFKPGQGKTLEGTLTLGSSAIIQYWRDGKSMMIRTASKSGLGAAATDVDVMLMSKVSVADINHFIGHYTVTVRPLGSTDPAEAVVREGPINCARF